MKKLKISARISRPNKKINRDLIEKLKLHTRYSLEIRIKRKKLFRRKQLGLPIFKKRNESNTPSETESGS